MAKPVVYNHREQYQGLEKAIRLKTKFTLLVAEFDGYLYRSRLIARLNSDFKNSAVLEVSPERFPQVVHFEKHLRSLSRNYDVIHVTAPEGFSYKKNWPEFYKALDYHRDKIARMTPSAVVLWFNPADAKHFAIASPNMWHWRSGIFHFTMPGHLFVFPVADDNIPARIDQIVNHLLEHPETGDDQRVFLYRELGELYLRSLDYGNAQKNLSLAADIYKKQGDDEKREEAEALKSLETIDMPEYTGILFMADVVDYTPQSNELGSKITNMFNRHYENTVRMLCETHGGMFIQRRGDGVLIFFSDKKKFLDFAAQLRQHSKEKKLDYQRFMGDIRMVAHYGSFSFQLVNENNIDLIGPEGIKVFRMEKHANPHELLVSEFLRDIIKNDLVSRQMEARKLKRVELKGFDQKQTLFKIEFPEEARAERSDFICKRLDDLERDTKEIPVFGELYEPMSMEDNFVNLEVHRGQDGGQDRRNRDRSQWEPDADELMAIRSHSREHRDKDTGQQRITVDVKKLYQTEKKGIILGLPGSGKTTIMKYFAFRDFKAKHGRNTSQNDTERLVLFIPCRGLVRYNQWFNYRHMGGKLEKVATGSIEPGLTLENCLAYFVNGFLAAGEGEPPKPEGMELRRAERWAETAFQNGRLTLLIDALDEAPGKEVKHDVAFMVKLLLNPGRKVKEGNRVFLTARFSERHRFISSPRAGGNSTGPLPVMDVRPLDMEQMRDMARYFYREDSELYKLFDRVVWQEEIAAKVGGTPLTSLLVIAYFEIFERFDTRYNMYHIIVVFVLIRAWKQMKENRFNKDMRVFFREARSRKILKEEHNAAHMYDALTLLSYEYIEVGRVVAEGDILDIFSRFAAHAALGDRVAVEEEAEQWLEQLKEDHLLVPAGAEKYVFIHSTVMEYLAARFIHEKVKNFEYLNHIFHLPPVLEHLEEKKAGFMETEILPIAVGSDLDTGLPLMRLLLKWKKAAKTEAEQETVHRLGLRCLAEYESFVDRQYKGKQVKLLHRDMEKRIKANTKYLDWVYRFLADAVLCDDPGQLKKTLEWAKPIARLSLPVFLEEYLPDPSIFSRGGPRETTSLREQIVDQLVNRDRVSEWIGKHRSEGKGQLIKMLRTLKEHGGVVNSVGFDNDGAFIISGSSDRTIICWDAKVVKGFRILKGHEHSVTSVAFSSDGKFIVSGSIDRTIKCWDPQKGKEIKTLKGHASAITSVAVSHNDALTISGSDDRTIKCWDLQTGIEKKTLEGHTDYVNSVAFSRDDTLIISGSDDHTIKCWGTINGKEIWTFKGHTSRVTCVGYSHGDTFIISGSSDHTIKCWDIRKRKEVMTFKGHTSGVTSIAFSHDDKHILSTAFDFNLKIWETKTGKCVETIELSGIPNEIKLNPNNPSIAVIANSNGTLTLLDLSRWI